MVLLFSSLGYLFHPAYAVSYGCGDTIYGGTVTLTGNITDCPHGGLYMAGGILNCNGYTISGTGSGVNIFDGINLGNVQGVTVENCIVKGFNTGIGMDYADGNVLTGNTAENNVIGFDVLSSTGNALSGNTANSNTQYGFDDGTSGSGTSGTGNTYVNNICNANTFGGSAPSGLCTDTQIFTALTIFPYKTTGTVGATIGFQADVTYSGGPGPTGSISWSDGGAGGTFTQFGCGYSSDNSIYYCGETYVPSQIGTIQITATYKGDGYYLGSTSTSTLTVGGEPTTTTFTCSPSTVEVGVSSQCTATVSSSQGPVPAEELTFTILASETGITPPPPQECVVSGSICQVTLTLTPTSLPTGIYEVGQGLEANYPGSEYVLSSSGIATLTVYTPKPSNTFTSVACSPTNAIVISSATTCTASVTGGSGSTDGETITWSQTGTGSATLSSSTCVLSSGSCSVTVTGSTAGSITLEAVYPADSTNFGSYGTTDLTVGLRTTSSSISCPSTVVVNEQFTCTSTTTDTSPGTPVSPTGSYVEEFATLLTPGSFTCSYTSNTGTCTLTFTATASGSFSGAGDSEILLNYGGNSNDLGSSASTFVTIDPRPTSLSVGCSPTTVLVSTPTFCTATVSDNSGFGTPLTPTGSVSFASVFDGTFSNPGPECSLVETTTGVASCSVVFTPSDTSQANPSDTVSATYSGDAGGYGLVHLGSSGNTALTVDPLNTLTTVSCTSPVDNGQASSCTVTVSDSILTEAPVTPTGTVALTSSGSGTFGTCTLEGSDGVATCSTSFTPSASGTDNILATYGGDTASDGYVIHIGSQGSSSLTVDNTLSVALSPSASTIDSDGITSATFTASASGGSSHYTVYTWNVPPGISEAAGTCTSESSTCTVTSTTVGLYFLGVSVTDSNGNTASSSPVSLNVNPQLSVSLTPPSATVAVGGTQTLTATPSDGTSPYSYQWNLPPGISATTGCGTSDSSCTVTPTVLGSYSLSVTIRDYVGGSATSSPVKLTVQQYTTSTTVSCAPNPLRVDSSTTCTATVTGYNPTGTVSFTSTSTTGIFSPVSGQCTLNTAGTCSVTYSDTIGEAVTISATYSHDTNNLPSSGSTAVEFTYNSCTNLVQDKGGQNLKGADLEYCDLSSYNLSGDNLMGANMQFTNLRGADLQGANLKGADLSNSLAVGANFQNVNLQKGNLANIDAAGASFVGANLQESNLSGASATNANFQGSNMRMADLSHGDFNYANFSHANLMDSNLSYGSFEYANFTGANTHGAFTLDADFTGASYPPS